MAALTRIARGVYRVEHDGRNELVYVTGEPGSAWAFWNGEVFQQAPPPEAVQGTGPRGPRTLTSPMPATIIKVLGAPGSAFKRGDTLVIVEAMKMELPIAAEHDGVVRAVHCHEGDLVQAGQPLVEVE